MREKDFSYVCRAVIWKAVLWIRLQHSKWIRILGFDDQKLKKKVQMKKNVPFFDQKLQFTYPQASFKDVQTTGEAFSPQKRTSSTSKMKFINFFYTFLGYFYSPGSGCVLEFNFLRPSKGLDSSLSRKMSKIVAPYSTYFLLLQVIIRQHSCVKNVFDHTSKAGKRLKVVLLHLWRQNVETTSGFICISFRDFSHR